LYGLGTCSWCCVDPFIRRPDIASVVDNEAPLGSAETGYLKLNFELAVAEFFEAPALHPNLLRGGRCPFRPIHQADPIPPKKAEILQSLDRKFAYQKLLPVFKNRKLAPSPESSVATVPETVSSLGKRSRGQHITADKRITPATHILVFEAADASSLAGW
jgi:hypothetical protein